MKAQLLTIGDELLIGQTPNTNATWLGEQLSQLGVRMTRTVTVGDDREDIFRELDRAYEAARLVVCTGGLGPTHDDRTRAVVGDYFGAPLQTDPDLLARVRDYYDRRNRDVPSSASSLAERPEGFEALANPVGAAVGLWHEAPDGRLIVLLPGIPEEMTAIFEASVQPRLEQEPGVGEVRHRTLVTAGIGETALQENLGDLSGVLGDDVTLAYLPSTSGVRVRLSASAEKATATSRLDEIEATIRDRAGDCVIGTGDVTLEQALGDTLRAHDATIASAESATGGLIGHRLTGVSGSSDYYLGSVVAYANSVKQATLDVEEAAIREHGAVSEAVALQMAEGVREALGTTVGISTTGIAGPTGGTPDKPVGTVWIGHADASGRQARRHQFVEDRTLNKELFASAALEQARRELSA
ncbi:competence/damage-inducible protein A [Salinibacter altiplanensis]|uniref:competence/damage-inducible protein A n=1 Tax=Salinibacter altiplanensis TaxID=1803181 RepID=UPI000C9F97BF|nr:competence/damage-inducible protein A [Salinibacter altiplanensis]